MFWDSNLVGLGRGGEARVTWGGYMHEHTFQSFSWGFIVGHIMTETVLGSFQTSMTSVEC